MNPGSTEAHEAGCLCPSVQNNGGEGLHPVGGLDATKAYWVIQEDCPMHGRATWKEMQGIRTP